MSKLQSNPRTPPIRSTRIGAAVTALGALVAIGVSVLILTLPGANHMTSLSAATRHHRTTTHIQPTCTAHFRDPATHALLCIQRAGEVPSVP